MKRKYASFLAIMCCLSLAIANSFVFSDSVLVSAESTVTESGTVVYDGLIFSISSTEAVLQGCEDTDAASITIPAEIDGKPVVFSLPAFRDCSALEWINVNENNVNLCSVDGVLFTKNKKALLEYPCARAGEYCIPAGTERVEYSAFQNCTGITSVALPYDLVLGAFAFRDCINLTEVNGTVKLEHGGAFIGCEKLTSLTIGKSTVSELMLQNMNGLISVNILPSCTFEKLIVADCPVLTELRVNGTVSDPVSTDVAIQIIGLPALTELQLPVNVKMTDNVRLPSMIAAVSECDVLQSITCRYPGSLIVNDCSSLTEIRFHETVSTDISVTSCDQLTTVYGRSTDAVLRRNCEQLGISFVSFEDSVSTGDVSADGEIGITDVIQLNRAILGGESLSSLSALLADFDGDGRITPSDSLLILKHLVGLI